VLFRSVSDDNEDHAPVKQWRRHAQQFGFVDLRRVRCPAKLVSAPTPKDTDEECDDGQPWERAPEEIFKVFHGDSPFIDRLVGRSGMEDRQYPQPLRAGRYG